MSDPYDTVKERTSILGPTIRFKGELSAQEDLIIQGTIEGSIAHMPRLTIGRDSRVQASVAAQQVIIEGTLEGDVHAEKSVEIKEAACMKGNIVAPSVTIRQGANFNGSVDMGAHPGAHATQPDASAETAPLRRPSSAA